MKKFSFVLICIMLLAGCNSQAANISPSNVPSTTATETPSPVNTPTASPSEEKNEVLTVSQIADKIGPSVVYISLANGEESETGFIFPQEGYQEGYIITTADASADFSGAIKVTLSDGRNLNATLIGADINNNIAVLKIAGDDLNPAEIGDSSAVKTGDTVIAIEKNEGRIQGEVTKNSIGISTGNGISNCIITDIITLNPWDGGCPLVDMSGKVIGINMFMVTAESSNDTSSSPSFECALPINDVMPIVQQIKTSGSVPRPGIGMSIVDSSYADYPSKAPEGVEVHTVIKGGPADTAGLQPNDIITSVDGTAVKTTSDLLNILGSHKVGDILNLTIWRAKKTLNIEITIGDLNKMNQ